MCMFMCSLCIFNDILRRTRQMTAADEREEKTRSSKRRLRKRRVKKIVEKDKHIRKKNELTPVKAKQTTS